MTDQVAFAFTVTTIVLGVIGLLLLVGGFIATIFFKKDDAGEKLAVGAGVVMVVGLVVSLVPIIFLT